MADPLPPASGTPVQKPPKARLIRRLLPALSDAQAEVLASIRFPCC